MISDQDIDAFKEDRAICEEGVRRYRKGLPEDRWHDGVQGHARFMRAVRRMLIVQDEMAGMMASMLTDIQSRASDSMEAHADPCRK